jgi:phosphoribosylamine--glycine ligase
MGTKIDKNELLSSGGRVLLVTGKGKTIEEAKENAYINVSNIECDNLIYRTDIGAKSIKK